jgi:hypothetical protein
MQHICQLCSNNFFNPQRFSQIMVVFQLLFLYLHFQSEQIYYVITFLIRATKDVS